MEVKEVCRLCLSPEKELVWVFDERLESTKHMKKLIHRTVGVEINKEDVVSQKICTKCGQDVIKLYRFREQSLKNDKILKGMHNRTTPKKTIHTSVTNIFKKYPGLRLPNMALDLNFSPMVEMEMDEVQNYFKRKNVNMEKHAQQILRNEKLRLRGSDLKDSLSSKETVSPISIKFVQNKSRYEIINKSIDAEEDGRLQNEIIDLISYPVPANNLGNHRKRRNSIADAVVPYKRLCEVSTEQPQSVIARRNSESSKKPDNTKILTRDINNSLTKISPKIISNILLQPAYHLPTEAASTVIPHDSQTNHTTNLCDKLDSEVYANVQGIKPFSSTVTKTTISNDNLHCSSISSNLPSSQSIQIYSDIEIRPRSPIIESFRCSPVRRDSAESQVPIVDSTSPNSPPEIVQKTCLSSKSANEKSKTDYNSKPDNTKSNNDDLLNTEVCSSSVTSDFGSHMITKTCETIILDDESDIEVSTPETVRKDLTPKYLKSPFDCSPHECQFCKRYFDSEHSLNTHLVTCTFKNAIESRPHKSPYKERLKNDDSNNKFKSQPDFSSDTGLKTPETVLEAESKIEISTPKILRPGSEDPTSSYSLSPPQESNQSKIECQICKISFDSKYSLNGHLATCTPKNEVESHSYTVLNDLKPNTQQDFASNATSNISEIISDAEIDIESSTTKISQAKLKDQSANYLVSPLDSKSSNNECETCKDVFDSKESLDVHLVICNLKNAVENSLDTTSRKEMLNKDHSNKNLEAPQTDFSSDITSKTSEIILLDAEGNLETDRGQTSTHLDPKETNGDSNNECEICKDDFHSKDSLNVHLVTCSSKNAADNSPRKQLEKLAYKKMLENNDSSNIHACEHLSSKPIESDIIEILSDEEDVVTPTVVIPTVIISDNKCLDVKLFGDTVNTIKELLLAQKEEGPIENYAQTVLTGYTPVPKAESIFKKSDSSQVEVRDFRPFLHLYQVPVSITEGKYFSVTYNLEDEVKLKKEYKDWDDLPLTDVNIAKSIEILANVTVDNDVKIEVDSSDVKQEIMEADKEAELVNTTSKVVSEEAPLVSPPAAASVLIDTLPMPSVPVIPLSVSQVPSVLRSSGIVDSVPSMPVASVPISSVPVPSVSVSSVPVASVPVSSVSPALVPVSPVPVVSIPGASVPVVSVPVSSVPVSPEPMSSVSVNPSSIIVPTSSVESSEMAQIINSINVSVPSSNRNQEVGISDSSREFDMDIDLEGTINMNTEELEQILGTFSDDTARSGSNVPSDSIVSYSQQQADLIPRTESGQTPNPRFPTSLLLQSYSNEINSHNFSSNICPSLPDLGINIADLDSYMQAAVEKTPIRTSNVNLNNVQPSNTFRTAPNISNTRFNNSNNAISRMPAYDNILNQSLRNSKTGNESLTSYNVNARTNNNIQNNTSYHQHFEQYINLNLNVFNENSNSNRRYPRQNSDNVRVQQTWQPPVYGQPRYPPPPPYEYNASRYAQQTGSSNTYNAIYNVNNYHYNNPTVPSNNYRQYNRSHSDNFNRPVQQNVNQFPPTNRHFKNPNPNHMYHSQHMKSFVPNTNNVNNNRDRSHSVQNDSHSSNTSGIRVRPISDLK